MRTRFYRFFLIGQLEKEEAWINDMADHGYGLICPHLLCYFDFEDVEPGKYGYKEVFLKGSSYSEKISDFVRFLEETGLKEVGRIGYPGHTLLYIRYEKADDFEEIYSDIDSKIEYEKTMCNYLFWIMILNFFAGGLNLMIVVSSFLVGRPQPLNIIGVINVAIAVACLISLIKKMIKIKKYKAERKIHE